MAELTVAIAVYNAEQDLDVCLNSVINQTFKDIEIIGHRNQFSKCFNIKNKFIDVIEGTGSDIDSKVEGINYKNFYATYLLGPFLIMNPLFAKYIVSLMGIKEMKYEKEAMEAYEKRMEYFHQDNARYVMEENG